MERHLETAERCLSWIDNYGDRDGDGFQEYQTRSPALYTAFRRYETTFPVLYIGANVPQAWPAGSTFMLTRAMLGFLPDALRNKLYVDPSLPVWLPDLTVQDLRVGKRRLDIRFWREGEQTAFEVIEGNPMLVERCDIVSKFAQLSIASDPLWPAAVAAIGLRGKADFSASICRKAGTRSRPTSHRSSWRSTRSPDIVTR